METTWFWLLAFVVATYVVLDGFDFGVGILHLFVARTPEERALTIRSVGPVWDGNEVWLLVAGGTMFMAFPVLLGTALSGFYLPVMILLWLLVFRALGIEMHHQLSDRIWTHFWDMAFAVSSLLLAIFIGAALANIFRGVPLDAEGVFFEPLWTDFRVGDETGILDWYTILVGLTAGIALAHHGALWLMMKVAGPVEHRAGRAAALLWPFLLATTLATVVASVRVQPHALESLRARPWGLVFVVLLAAALVAARGLRRAGRPGAAFLASAAYLYATLAAGASCLYPYVLPARLPEFGLTAHAAASSRNAMATGLTWWIPGMLLACGYFVFLYARMPARFTVDDDHGHA